MKKITIEEHFTTEEQLDYFRSILDKEYPVPEVIQDEKALGKSKDRSFEFINYRKTK